jgi:hypothetical protein
MTKFWRHIPVILLFLGAMTSFCFAQSSVAIDNLAPEDVWISVHKALSEKGSAVDYQSADRIVSEFCAYSAHFMQYRAKYVFRLDGNSLTISLDQRQQKTTSGWQDPTFTAKGAEEKLITQMAELVRTELSHLAKSAPEPAAATPATAHHTPQNAQSSSSPAYTQPMAVTADQQPNPNTMPFPDTSQAAGINFDESKYYICGEGLCAVLLNGKLGFIDAQGKVVINFQFHVPSDEAMPRFQNGVCMIYVDSGHGGFEAIFIDKKGNRLFPGKIFTKAYAFVNDVALVMVHNPVKYTDNWQFIDIKGRPLSPLLDLRQGSIPMGFSSQDLPFHDGLLPFSGSLGDKFGFLNSAGKWVIAPRYSGVHPFHEGIAWVYDDDAKHWGGIDTKGNTVIPFVYQNEPGDFSDGMAAVTDRFGRMGYIDKSNNLLIPCKYDDDKVPFLNGHTVVKYKNPAAGPIFEYVLGKDGVELGIDPKIHWSPQTNMVGSCHSGDGLCHYQRYARTIFGDRTTVGLMTYDGHIVLPAAHFISIGDFHDGLAYFVLSPQNGKEPVQGFMNDKFEIVVIRTVSNF